MNKKDSFRQFVREYRYYMLFVTVMEITVIPPVAMILLPLLELNKYIPENIVTCLTCTPLTTVSLGTATLAYLGAMEMAKSKKP